MKKERHESPRINTDELHDITSAIDPAMLAGEIPDEKRDALIKLLANENSILKQKIVVLTRWIIQMDESFNGGISDLEERADNNLGRIVTLENILDKITWGGKKLWLFLATLCSLVIGVVKGIEWVFSQIKHP